MENTIPKKQRGPKPLKSREERQQHILDAALHCVRKSGFHGASMAEIASEAKVSVGVIYRYFANKEAIVEAIVANDLADLRDKFSEWEDVPDDQLLDTLLDTLMTAIEHKYVGDTSALGLEVLAEAARNTRVAAIVQSADSQERELGLALCRRMMPQANEAQLVATGEIASMIFDGMMVRAISNPNIDRKALLHRLKTVMRHIFTLPPNG